MSEDEPSRHDWICLMLLACIFTLALFYVNTPPSGVKLARLSKKIIPDDSSKSRSSHSPNLMPPSQAWVRDQVNKAMSTMYLEYAPPNDWESCTQRTYYFPKINTVFTGIHKTGCSNWLMALLGAEGRMGNVNLDPLRSDWVHDGITDGHRIKRMAKQYHRSVFESAFSFTVVRNPWTRMVSGYRQRLSSENTQAAREMGKTIVKETRGITDPEVLEDLYPTFEEYVRYLVKQSGDTNYHFTLQTRELCIPQAMYDFIVPLEHSATLNQEVWSRINGSDTSLLGSYDKESDPRLQSSALYAKKWLSELDPELIEQFYSVYEADFILMNYSNFTHPDFPLPLHSSGN